VFCLTFVYYSLLSELWPMLPVFLDYTLLITLCVLFNVYLLQSVQCVVANVTFVPRLLIVDYPLCFCLRFIYYSLFSELWPMLPLFRDYSLLSVVNKR
jgi:hypothetical protein